LIAIFNYRAILREAAMRDLTGSSGKPRIRAFIIDNLAATVLAFLLVAVFKSGISIVSVIVLCLTYLLYYLIFEAIWGRTPGKFIQGVVPKQPEG